MDQSSISQLPADGRRRLSGGLQDGWRLGIGRELRRRRIARRMTQSAVGGPLTKAFVSAVETGRATPSLPALRLMVSRLDATLSEFFAGVEEDVAGAHGVPHLVDLHLTRGYHGSHDDDRGSRPPPGGGRQS